jgi:hypothetical protein
VSQAGGFTGALCHAINAASFSAGNTSAVSLPRFAVRAVVIADASSGAAVATPVLKSKKYRSNGRGLMIFTVSV